MTKAILRAACAILASVALQAAAHSLDSPKVLVASAAGSQEYGESVVLALPLENGAHYGFVLNRPTDTTLSALFPEEEASSLIQKLVSLGGPELTDSLFAVVHVEKPADGLRIVTSELAVAIALAEVEGVIAKRADDARFFMGLVLWAPGQLAEQVSAGSWHVLSPKPEIVMSARPAGLWQRLVPSPGPPVVDGAARAIPAVGWGKPARQPDPARFPRGVRLRHG